jgi:hypothetical protein
MNFARLSASAEANCTSYRTRDAGPRYFLIGTHRRITEQARQDWHRQLEAEATANIAATPTTPISRSGGK